MYINARKDNFTLFSTRLVLNDGYNIRLFSPISKGQINLSIIPFFRRYCILIVYKKIKIDFLKICSLNINEFVNNRKHLNICERLKTFYETKFFYFYFRNLNVVGLIIVKYKKSI